MSHRYRIRVRTDRIAANDWGDYSGGPEFLCETGSVRIARSDGSELAISVGFRDCEELTLYRRADRNAKWRIIYAGPLPTDEDAIFEAFGKTVAKRLG